MPDNVSFRLVKGNGSEISKWYPFWIGTIVGFAFVFFAFLLAVVEISRANRTQTSFFDFSDRMMTQIKRGSMMQKDGVRILTPAKNASVSGKIQISAVSDKNASAVKFLLDGAEIAVFSAEPYVFAWDTAGAKNGEHIIAVLATDAIGYSTITQQSVTVAN
ncbi:MAG: Ig-like domain-containing protein [bacterium]|nr:Ig-like domain-containing protein [bacterium]